MTSAFADAVAAQCQATDTTAIYKIDDFHAIAEAHGQKQIANALYKLSHALDELAKVNEDRWETMEENMHDTLTRQLKTPVSVLLVVRKFILDVSLKQTDMEAQRKAALEAVKEAMEVFKAAA